MTDAILDQVTLQFLAALKQDAGFLQHTAKKLFFDLALIQLTFSALWMSFTGTSLQNMLVRLVQLMLGFSVLYACIESGREWVPLIINGFIQIGQQSGLQSLSPSAIIGQGLSISGAMLKAFFGWGVMKHPFVAMIGSINCIAVIVLYALLAAELVIILVKSYVLVALSSLFFALGANQATRTMTMNYTKTVLGIGLQLMTLYFLLGVGQSIGSDWAAMTLRAAEQHEMTPMLAILSAVIVYYMVIKNVPAFIAGLAGVGGFRNYGDAAVAATLGGAMQSKRLFGHTGQKTVGLGQAGGQIAKALSQSTKAGLRGNQDMSLGNIASATGTATGALAKATLRSSKDWMMKQNRHYSLGQKVNHHLANSIKP